MAVPKRKWSKARSRRAASNWKITAPTLVKCSHCNALTAPHMACKECGYYKGREVYSKDDD